MFQTNSNVASGSSSAASFVPPAYKGQDDDTATYQNKGTTRLVFSGACSAGNANRIIIHCLVPHNAAAGTTGHTPVMTYKYYYT